MLAYVIIAVELLILYTVFWYVFLREPKPYRIKGNAWGVYDGPNSSIKSFAQGFDLFGSGQQAHGDNCGCQVDRDNKLRSASAIYEEWNTQSSHSSNVPLTAGELIRSQSRGVERINNDGLGNGNQDERMQYRQATQYRHQYLPHNPAEQYRSKHNSVPTFLAKLGDALNRINVKLP